MAVHYYDEVNIEVGKPINGQVVVNHTIELTQKEKDHAHKEAIEKAMRESYSKLTKKKSTPNKLQVANQLSLF